MLRWQWPKIRNPVPPSNPPVASEQNQPVTSCHSTDQEATTGVANSQSANPSTEPPAANSDDAESGESSSADKNKEETRADLPVGTSGNSALSSSITDEEHPDATDNISDVDNSPAQGSTGVLAKTTSGGQSLGASVPKKNIDSKENERGERKPGRNSPHKIGSRRTRTTTTTGRRSRRPPAARPELICRRPPGSWQWEVTLSVDDECGVTAVYRDGEPLEMMNRECRLSSLTGRLTIAFEDGENDKFTLFDGKPLIFKLQNDWTGEGRKTRSVTKGYFIVIAPCEWERTGRAPVEPEGCSDNEFRAHYFYRNGAAPTENSDGFRQCEVPTNRSGFEFIGTCVFDDSEFGDLFVGAVPTLKLSSNIAWARVGEERVNGWKGNNFRPGEGCLSDVLNGRQGRFFIRVYDSQVKLLDSGEFRYFRDLKEIRVNGERYTEYTLLVPPATGHLPTKVRFVGIDGTAIQPILPFKLTHSKEQGDDFLVEPTPSRDRIECVLESNTGRVDTVLNLPRIWWRIERYKSKASEWHDTPLIVSRREFRECAHLNATMQLRYPRRITSVRAGFDDELDRVYQRKNRENACVIPLADFVDYSQIDQPLSQDASFNVEFGGVKLTLIQVSCDPVPAITSFTREPAAIAVGEQATLRWATQNAEAGDVTMAPEIGPVALNGSLDVAPSETTTYTLRLMDFGKALVTKTVTVSVRSSHLNDEKPIAWVIRAGGSWKHGKGFSYREILAAGLTVAGSTQWSLPYDKRRRSMHQVNIESIRRWTDA